MITDHIISYHIASYNIISYHIISYHIASYNIISYHIILYHVTSYHITSFTLRYSLHTIVRRIFYFLMINNYCSWQNIGDDLLLYFSILFLSFPRLFSQLPHSGLMYILISLSYSSSFDSFLFYSPL